MYESLNVCRRVRISPFRKGAGPTFTLTMWDDVGYDPVGRILIRYSLVMTENRVKTVLFEGSNFGTRAASDSDETVACLLDFLTLRPGDTDAEYFEGYTEDQLAYCSAHAEALALESSRRFSKEAR